MAKNGIKYGTTQVESQENSSFLADGHQTILNKVNKKSKTNRRRTNNDNQNQPQQKHPLGTVSNNQLLEVGVDGILNLLYSRDHSSHGLIEPGYINAVYP